MKTVQDKGNQAAGSEGLSRRTMLGGAALVVGVGASAMMATSASAKTAQSAAKYQDSPKDGAKCGSCNFFKAPDSCQVVDGKVSENGWCQLYSKKA